VRLFDFLRETFAGALNLLRSPEGLKSLCGVSLYRNAVYLMLNSAVLSLTGFWTLAAKGLVLRTPALCGIIPARVDNR